MMQHVCDAKPHVAHRITLVYPGKRCSSDTFGDKKQHRNRRDAFMCFYCTDQRTFNMNHSCDEDCRLLDTCVWDRIRTAGPVF